MALPSAYTNETKYFKEAVQFLKENQHFYNYPNTDILTENIIDKINILEHINVFDKDFHLKIIPEMKHVLEQVEKLTCFYNRQAYSEVDSELFYNVPLSLKKKHEIIFLSQEIHRNCQAMECDTVVDFGCGLGYLDQLLFKKYNYKILGLEYNNACLKGAERRQNSYHKESIDYVKYVKHFVSDTSSVAIEEILNEHFPMSRNVCIVGLHACADLTVDAMSIFLKMKQAKCLVLMPCCYHKMSLISSQACVQRGMCNFNEIRNEIGSQDELHGMVSTGTVDSQNIATISEENKTDEKHLENVDADALHDSDRISRKESNTEQKKCQHFWNFPLSDTLKRTEDGQNIATISEENKTNEKHSENVDADALHDSDRISRKESNTEKKKCQHFWNFPLSDTFKSIYTESNGSEYLRIPFLRLAAQPQSVDEDLNTLVFRLLSRAVLQLYCCKNKQRLVKKKRRAVRLSAQSNDFFSYLMDATQNGFSLKCDDVLCTSVSQEAQDFTLNPPEVAKTCKCKSGFKIKELMDLWQHSSDDLTVKRAAILILLQRHLQPMFENLVLYDRCVYLKENGVENCNFLKIVDEKISPRCLAFVAGK